MTERVNRDGFPKTGNYLSFLKMYCSLSKEKRKNVFINATNDTGLFNYCVFPSEITAPQGAGMLLSVAESVAEIMNGNHLQVEENRPQPGTRNRAEEMQHT